ncbi:Short-chain dehydrogenase [Nakamurella panacisegetis]|uniref:Short-chain dehydrogenase n=1 Tax=Nakamurella panacisegetis TaxID=1090615 RepID=A0A1H0S5U4_9ACTN|nr:SDR family NAD(P)-dependent oxidoreductase [Nakamurella panacisegetis]SDP36909.1 Short-chain dehydrogenase [Nakamurella panacisegetis]
MAHNPVRSSKVALVMGASSGIGLASALILAAEGWSLVLVARSHPSLDRAAARCVRLGAPTLVVEADVGDSAAVDAAFTVAAERFGRIDAVVNTAAAVAYGRFADVPVEVFDKAITTNLLGTANVARAALRHFGRRPGRGDLVLVGSLLGKIAVPMMSSYVTGKWGVQGLARILQIEARETPDVHVSLVSPGSVNTPAYSQAASYLGWHGRPPPPVDSPDKVAAAVVGCLNSSRRDRSVGIANGFVIAGFRLLPSVFDLLVTPLMKLAGLSNASTPPTAGNVLQAQPDGDQQYGQWPHLFRRPRRRVAR